MNEKKNARELYYSVFFNLVPVFAKKIEKRGKKKACIIFTNHFVFDSKEHIGKT